MPDYADALDSFLASTEGLQCVDPVSLGVSIGKQPIMRNRLEAAFRQGWLAARARYEWTPIVEPEGIEVPPEPV